MSNKGGRVSPDYLADIAPEYAETTGQTGEAVTCEGTDEYAHENITEVVFADKDAADCHHEGPEEHPPTVCLEPFRHGGI